MITDKQIFINTIKSFHPEKSLADIEKEYEHDCEVVEKLGEERLKASRHIPRGTEIINFKPWSQFDVKEVHARSPHPLQSVKLGYMYKGDIPCDSKDVEGTSVSSKVTRNASEKGGISIEIMSLEDATKKAKKIDWTKVPIEK